MKNTIKTSIHPRRRVLALVLALSLLSALLPATVFAAEPDYVFVGGNVYSADIETTIEGIKYLKYDIPLNRELPQGFYLNSMQININFDATKLTAMAVNPQSVSYVNDWGEKVLLAWTFNPDTTDGVMRYAFVAHQKATIENPIFSMYFTLKDAAAPGDVIDITLTDITFSLSMDNPQYVEGTSDPDNPAFKETIIVDPNPSVGVQNGTITISTPPAVEAGFEYTLYDFSDGSQTITAASITRYLGSDSAVSIPATLGGYPVKEIGEAAFQFNEDIISVVIPDGVASIGEHAFSNCPELESVSIPDSVLEIGLGAFYDCVKLNNVSLPSGLIEIPIDLFGFGESLTSITIPENVTKIGLGAFNRCHSLTDVNIPASVTEIGWGAFSECDNLARVTIVGGDVLIDCYAFAESAQLKEIYFESTPPVLGEKDGESGMFDNTHPELTLYYPATLAADWAPNGGTTWEGYKIAAYYLPGTEPDYGDANCDGKLTAADAALILRFIVKLDPLSGVGLANADANGDGKITAADAALVLRFIVKLENKLGPK